MHHSFDKKEFSFALRFLILPAFILAGIFEVVVNLEPRAPLAATLPPMEEIALVTEIEATETVEEAIRLGFVGDIMLDRGVEESVIKYASGDFKFIFAESAPELQSYDFLFGNLEGPLSDKGKNQGSIYSFRMSPAAIEALIDAGFDAVSLANNHMSDYGTLALLDTLDRLKQADIIYVGAGKNAEAAYEIKYAEIRDTKLALIAMTEFNSFFEAGEGPGMSIIEPSKIAELVKEADGKADIVIISFHYGTEYQKEANSYQKMISKAAVDAGADLVIGHHPHVVQPVEKYKNGYIAYSLGNFVFDQYFSEDTMEGALLEVLVQDGEIIGTDVKKVKLNSKYQPRIEQSLGSE